MAVISKLLCPCVPLKMNRFKLYVIHAAELVMVVVVVVVGFKFVCLTVFVC